MIAGISPSYTGGPYTWLRQYGADGIGQQAAAASARDKALFSMPSSLSQFIG